MLSPRIVGAADEPTSVADINILATRLSDIDAWTTRLSDGVERIRELTGNVRTEGETRETESSGQANQHDPFRYHAQAIRAQHQRDKKAFEEELSRLRRELHETRRRAFVLQAEIDERLYGSPSTFPAPVARHDVMGVQPTEGKPASDRRSQALPPMVKLLEVEGVYTCRSK
ncbi:hypothetical protein AURDEDRAFT_172127 [Auricularia subglabra TFB-10046 SS5]|nr:hypothetical protein AURDEDRAFT_172127 [Auricularia subglabra TFB-10046 SS5]